MKWISGKPVSRPDQLKKEWITSGRNNNTRKIGSAVKLNVLCVPWLFPKHTALWTENLNGKKGSFLHQQFKALRLCIWSCHSIEEYTRYLETWIPHWCFSFLYLLYWTLENTSRVLPQNLTMFQEPALTLGVNYPGFVFSASSFITGRTTL